jgi:hypothetical protein
MSQDEILIKNWIVFIFSDAFQALKPKMMEHYDL